MLANGKFRVRFWAALVQALRHPRPLGLSACLNWNLKIRDAKGIRDIDGR